MPDAQVVLFHAKTLKDITDFLRDFHNKWTDALGKSFLSVILDARQHNQSWLAHAKLNRISAASCGRGENSFATRCWAYVCLPEHTLPLLVSGVGESHYQGPFQRKASTKRAF